MASDNEASCVCDPNFAVICSFLEKFAKSCGITYPNFLELQEMLENSQEVPQPLVDLHVKLLRKARKSVSGERWERALIKFCHSYSNQDGWEVERFGYKKARLAVKLRILKMLLELQFDLNTKFKTEVNKLSAEELRSQPLGRDKLGQTYWCQLDEDCNLRVYREDLDDETWEVVAKDREGMVQLISQLSSNDPFRNGPDAVLNEDSNSLEIEKPIIDTGQVVESPADEEDDEEFEEIEDEEEEEDGNQHEKEKKSFSVLNSELKREDKASVKFTVKESQDETKTASINRTEVTISNKIVKKNYTSEDKIKMDNGQSEGKRARDSVHVEDKKKTNASEIFVEKITKFETGKEQEILDTEKHATDHNKNVSKTNKVTSKISIESKGSSTLQNTNRDITKDNKSLPVSKKIDASSIKKEELLGLVVKKGGEITVPGEKSKTSDKANSDAKAGDDVSIKKPCISVRPLEQLVSKDRCINPLKLEPKIILQKQSFNRGICSDLKEQMHQETVRKNVERNDFQQQKLKNEDFCKVIVNEITSKNIITTNIGQRDETRGLHLEQSKWNEGGFDLRSPIVGNKLSGNDSRGLDLSGKKVVGIPYAKGLLMSDTFHKTQENICDLSMRRPTDNYPLLKDMQKHSKNVVDDTLYKGSSGLATDLTLRKPNSSYLNLSQTLKEEKRSDNILKVDMKASTNVITEKLKSVDCVNAKNNQDKDATISGTKRDINDTEIMQAKKPRFENLPKTIENPTVVGEAIEEPLMLIRGEGFGKDCNMGNPVFRTEEENNIEVSEAIEEPVFFVWGEGSGKDCDTGNTSRETETDDRNKNTQSGTTPLDEDKNLSANKSTDNNKETSNTGLKVEHNAGGLDKGSDISDLKTAVNPQIDNAGNKSQPSSFSSSKDFPKDQSSEKHFLDETSDVIPSGEQSSMNNEACSIKDKIDVSESNEWQLENTNSNKMSAGDSIDTQLELAIQDKGMKDSINTKLKQFHSSSESLQTSSSQSYSFSASTVMSASCIQPSPSAEILSVSPGVFTSHPATDLTKSIPSERIESSKIDVLPKEIGKEKLINKGEDSHQNETLKIPHPLEFKPQETSFVSSTSKQVFPQITSLREPGSSDVLDMSVKKDSLICVPSKSNEDFKMFSGSASKSSSSATSLLVESKSNASIAESPQCINIELDKTKSEVLRPSEAPLPVTKRFLHQTCSTTKAVDSITLKIPEPEKGDIHGTVSPTKTPPKLWSIETICAPDQKHRESRDVPITECGSSNPAAYPKPELLSQILPNKPKWTLGVQVIQKSTGDNISLHKRISRWDVGKPLEESKSQETQSAKDSRSMTKAITSKVPNVDSFSSVKSCVDRLSVDSGEQFDRKTELVSSLDISKMSVISSGSGSMTDERLSVTTQESFTHSSEDIASSIGRIPSSNSSNYSSSCLNMPLDIRLYGTSMKHENPREDDEVVSHNVSKSSLSEIQNVKLSSMSLQKLEKSEPLVLGNSSTKLPAKDKETVDSSSHIFGLADKDKQSSLFSHQNFLEKEKIPKKGFFFGPGCFEFTDKKSEVVDKMVAPDTSKSYNVSDKVENAEDKKESKETTSISIVRKDVDKITTKSDASSERNIGKVVDFLTQKNAGKYFGTSTDKCVGDKAIMKGMASAIDKGGRKSTDSSGERSIDKVIGLLTEKSARMAETKNVEKRLDSNHHHPPKDKIIDNSIKTANGNEKTISDINIPEKGGNSVDKTCSNKPVQNPMRFAAKKDAEENKQKFSTETKGGTAIEKSEKLFGSTGNTSLGKELGENRTEEILFVTGISNIASKCDSSQPEQVIKFISTEPKSDAAATKVTGEISKSLSDIRSSGEVERVKFSGIIENNTSENSENQIEKLDNKSVIPTLGTLSVSSGSIEDKSSENRTSNFTVKKSAAEPFCKEIESTDISDDDKGKTITEHAAESTVPSEDTDVVANKLSDKFVNKDKQNDRKEYVKVSDTSEKIADKDDVSEKKDFSGNSIAELISSSISSVKKDEENHKSIGKPGEMVISKTITESTDTPEKTIEFELDIATKKSEISSEKNENSSSKDSIKSNIVESDKFPEVEGNFCGSEIADKNIEKSIKTDTVLEKTPNSEAEKIRRTTEAVSDMELDKNEENAVKSPEKTISSGKLSDQFTDVTEDITSIHVPSNIKDSIAKKTADICSEVTAEPSPIPSSKGDEETGKMVVTSSADKELNKEEKDGADRQKEKTTQDNQKNKTAGPLSVKSLTVQGKSNSGNLPAKMGQSGMMGSGKGRRKSVENITMGIMMSKLAGKSGLDSQAKFPVPLPVDNKVTDKIIASAIPDTQPLDKQTNESAQSSEKPVIAVDPPAETEKSEQPPKRTGFITLKPIETLLEKPRINFQDVKDVKHDFGFVKKPLEVKPLPDKPYLYPVTDPSTERIVDNLKAVPNLGITPVIRHPVDQQKTQVHSGNIQPLRHPGVFPPERMDTPKEIVVGRPSTMKPDIKWVSVQKCSVALENLPRSNKLSGQDDKSGSKSNLLPVVQSSEKLLQTLNTSVSIVEKSGPAKQVECDKVQQKMDMRERHQDLTIITKDVSTSTPKTRGQASSPKNQASAPSRVHTLSPPKSTNKAADANSKFVQNRDAKSSGNKDSQKTITGDKDLDSKLLKSGAVSVTFVTNIDKKKNNAEAKETVSISKNSTNLNESSQKGKVGNSKSISASKEKASDSKTLQLQVKSSTPKSSSELKESNGFRTEKMGDTPKSPEGKDTLSKIEEQDVKGEDTEKVDDEDKTDKFPVKKESHINSGVSIQSLTFDYNPESNDIEEITGIRTRLTRSYGKPAPKYPEKPKKGKNARTKPAEKKEKEEEKEEAPVTRSRRTRSSGPLPSVEEVKKPPSTKSKKAGTSNEKIEMKAKPIAQKRRNSRRLDSQSEDEGVAAEITRKRSLANSETVGDAGGKRRKLRSKRMPDLKLRRSVEEQKLREGRDSSSDEDRCNDIPSRLEDITDESHQAPNEDASVKGKGKSAVRPRGKGRDHGRGKGALGSCAVTDSPAISSDVPSDTSRTEPPATPEPTTKSKPSPKKTRRILGLDVGVDIILEETNKESCSGPPVRQSRRIAQIKIKEEAERRKLEEMTLMELKEQQRRRKHDENNDSKDSMSDKRKRKKKAAESDEDFTVEEEPEEPAMSKKKKKKKKKRKKKSGKGFSDNPWQSTSGSSSSSSMEEEEEQEQTEEEEDESNLVFKSDHEFSPESDLENENGEVQPTRRARTAQKESDGEEVADDHACQKCGKSDHPEWILLCDKCDSGWHGSCLRPALLVIPEGDWFCPPCEHTFLLTNLQDNLREYDKTLKRRENEELRRKRLAYVGISLDNVLPNKEKEAEGSVPESEEEKSSSSSESGSSSSEESEPLYHLRERRQTLFSYRFNEYDDLINSAIQDEMEAVKGAGNQGRGKDIATIVNAEKEEMAAAAGINGVGKEGKAKKNEKDADGGDDYQEENEEDEEEEEGYIPPVRKFVGRKKHRRLNSLDISSEDDADSDEDFKGSSSEDEEEEEDDLELVDSEDSDVIGRRGRGGRRSKRLEPVRRSTRARITRFDKEFINDDSDESIEPRRKKTRRLWQESDSSESDSTWGRKKKRKYHAETHRPKSKKKKKKKHSKDVDGENSKNKSKNPRIKYGGLDDDDDDSSPLPRTRGRKINYQEIVGSESEEELMRAVTKGIESEDEYVASEEEEKMLEDEEEVEPEAEDEEEDEGEGEAELKLKIKSKPQHKQDADTKAKTKEEEEEEEVEAAAIEAAEEEEKTEVPSEPELPIKEDTDIKDDKVDVDEEDNILPFKVGKKKREKPEKKPKAPRKPREKKPKQEKKPKAERKPKKSRITCPKKQVIHDDTDDELENFGEEFDDLEEGEIRLGAMLDEREDLMDEELLDEELMDEEKEMEDMLEEELLDEEELDEEDEEDELLAMKEAELALQQAELEKAKEKKRQKREAKKLEKKEQKKRGKRAKKMDDIISSLPINDNAGLEGEQPTDSVQNIMKEIETPPQTVPPIVLPVMSSMSGPVTSPLTPKRRGRGRGKAASAAIADTSSAIGGLVGKLSESGQLGPSLLGAVGSPRYPGPNQQQSQPMTFPSQPPHSNSSVISRMLQSQPVSGAPQSFTAAAAAMGHKYFGGPGSDQPPLVGPGSVPPGNQNTSPSTRGSGSVGQSYSIPTRGRIPSPYRQPPPLTSSPSGSPGLNMPHYAGMRGSPVRPPPGPLQQTNLSPLRMRTPGPGTQGPQIYHTSHHPLDPSPSGGGPIAIASNNGVRQGGEGSPLHQPPTQIPPAAGSPLAGKSGPPPSHSTPPPPPYTRAGPLPAMHQQGPPVPPPLIRFPLQSTDIASSGRHPQSPFPPSTTTGNHLQAQPSPPPHQGRSPAPGNFSPYHPPPPPNYHYGAYPPPPPLTAADDALPPSAYQGSPYPDHYASPDATHSLQASDGSNSKSFDEEGGGEFGGLVSYFSSQREDDLDT